MENINLDATNYTPFTTFSVDGNLKLEGRSYPENAAAFYDPLIDFTNYLESKVVRIDINLEYINTASSKKLLHLLQVLDDNESLKKIMVNWHYEEGDEDSVETAEIYEESLDRVEFAYCELADLTL